VGVTLAFLGCRPTCVAALSAQRQSIPQAGAGFILDRMGRGPFAAGLRDIYVHFDWERGKGEKRSFRPWTNLQATNSVGRRRRKPRLENSETRVNSRTVQEPCPSYDEATLQGIDGLIDRAKEIIVISPFGPMVLYFSQGVE